MEAVGGHDNLTKDQAVELVKKAVRVCYLRDCRASLRYHIAVIDETDAKVEGPFTIDIESVDRNLFSVYSHLNSLIYFNVNVVALCNNHLRQSLRIT